MVLVYMVLASQFNSFMQPLIVMVAQPLAIIGGVAALWITGHTLNIYSMIGLVLLMGLVAKNSILLVDLANQCARQGHGGRCRPARSLPDPHAPGADDLAATVILALLPAALGVGAGAETNAPLAVAVIGGMISSTLLTLVVVPAVYSLVEKWMEKRAAKSAMTIRRQQDCRVVEGASAHFKPYAKQGDWRSARRMRRQVDDSQR